MPPLSADVCVLCESRPGPSENCAKKIAEFLGANVSFVPVSGQRIDSIRELIPADAVLVLCDGKNYIVYFAGDKLPE